MSMDQFLANFYGTNQPAQEDLEKSASVDLFLKLASEQKIDLRSMSEEQVAELYARYEKNAAAAPPANGAPTAAATKTAEEKEHEKKLEEAKKEHEEKRAMAEKVAEHDFLGRVMAHSYVQELRKIAADPSITGTPAAVKVAELPPALLAHMKGKDEHKDGGHEEKKDEHHKEEHKDDKKDEHHKEGAAAKQATAIDTLGAERAVVLAKEAGFNTDEAVARINAIFTLGLQGESTKIASAPDVGTAVETRALELLEKAGYPVTWKDK